MKKIYILASALVLASSVHAQKISTEATNYRPVTDLETTKSSSSTLSGVPSGQEQMMIPGDVLWYEDFANGLAGNSSSPVKEWTRGSSTGFSTNWVYGTTGGTRSGVLNSETYTNGFMTFDAWAQVDLAGGAGNIVIDGYLESPEINISTFGTSFLALEIQHNYASCCSGADYPVSIFVGFDDGTGNYIWTEKNSGNESLGHNLLNAPNESGRRGVEKRLMGFADVAKNAVNSGSNKIKFRFHWNYEVNPLNDYYWWMLDDIRIKEIPAADSRVVNFYTGDIVSDYEYAMIPRSQITNYETVLLADITNLGGLDLTNVALETTITDPSNNVVFSNSGGTFGRWRFTPAPAVFLPSASKTLGTGADSTMFYFTGFIPADNAWGDYNVTVKSVHSENDQNPSDNVANKKFAQSRYEWNHFNNARPTGTWVVNDGSALGEAWQNFVVNSNATVYGITTLLRDNATTQNTVGAIGYVALLDNTGEEIQRKEFTITADMINPTGVNNQRTFIRFDDPIPVTAGSNVWAVIGSFGAGDNLVIATELDGDYDFSTRISYPNSNEFYLGGDDFYIGISFENRSSGVFCAAPNAPTLSSATTSISCGDVVTIDVTGTLGNAGAWYLYSGACGGTLIATTTTGSFTFSPSTTATYYVRGEGGECVVFPGACGEITITVGGDTDSPVPDVASLPDITAPCYVLSGDLVAPTATDACVGSIIGTTNATFPISSSTTITWTYDDGNGNISSQDQEIIISFVNPPVPDVATLADITEDCLVTSLTAPTANDGASATIIGTTDVILPITESTTITWTYSDGCNRKTTQTQNIVISDLAPPVADNDPLADITEACELDLTTVTAPTATDDVSGTVNGVADVATVTVTGVITWTYTDGCGRTSTQTQNVTITDSEAPVPDLATLADVTVECQVANSGALTPPTATDNCSSVVTVEVTGATFPIKTSQTITWTYTDANGNSSTQTQDIVITNEIDRTTTVTGGTISANEAGAGVTYQWINCTTGANVSGATGKDFSPTSSGLYRVRITKGTCVEESTCSPVTATVGISSQEEIFSKVYPNPASVSITIELASLTSTTSIEITDVTGKVTKSVNVTSNKTVIDVSDLSTGIYIIKVKNDNGFNSLKFIKE